MEEKKSDDKAKRSIIISKATALKLRGSSLQENQEDTRGDTQLWRKALCS